MKNFLAALPFFSQKLAEPKPETGKELMAIVDRQTGVEKIRRKYPGRYWGGKISGFSRKQIACL